MSENPPAFPNTGNSPRGLKAAYGMSLRDWFAGQALAGALACPTMRSPMTASEYALLAYQTADAMLSARSNQGDQ